MFIVKYSENAVNISEYIVRVYVIKIYFFFARIKATFNKKHVLNIYLIILQSRLFKFSFRSLEIYII